MPTTPFHDEPLPTDDPERQRRWAQRQDAWCRGDDWVADIPPASGNADPDLEDEKCSR